jgi:hypothetical protein
MSCICTVYITTTVYTRIHVYCYMYVYTHTYTLTRAPTHTHVHTHNSSFFQSVCTLGYCLLPLALSLLISRVILMVSHFSLLIFFIRFAIIMVALLWSSWGEYWWLRVPIDWYDVITPRAHALQRDKTIRFVCHLSVVSTKIASSISTNVIICMYRHLSNL